MTTTADKIEILKRQADVLRDWAAVIEKEIKAFQVESNVKPPDHEPLECWVNTYDKTVGGAYATLKGAESFLSKGGKTIHMREVTPQDEQNREDARRYREYCKLKTLDELIDNKPLECWANQIHSGYKCEYFNSPAEAMERVNSHKAFRRAVYMRQVTPQDEQDRKEARRYRHGKSFPTIMKYIVVKYPADKWDEMIDKAIEEG